MTLDLATKIVRAVANRFGVRLLGVDPASSDTYEVRLKHGKLDWFSVLQFDLSESEYEFKDRVITLAEACARGPAEPPKGTRLLIDGSPFVRTDDLRGCTLRISEDEASKLDIGWALEGGRVVAINRAVPCAEVEFK